MIILRVAGKEYKVSEDPAQFTAAELNAVERHTGMTLSEWAHKLANENVSILAWSALAWIAVRRSGDYVRWDLFEDKVNVQELLESIVGEADEEPDDPAFQDAG